MKISNYSYNDFIIYSLSYFGLSEIVVKTMKSNNLDELAYQHTIDVIMDCNNLDLSDKAKNFRLLYKHFCLNKRINKDQLIADMLTFCA